MLNIFKKENVIAQVAPLSNISSLVRAGNNLFSDALILLDEALSGNLFCSDKIVVEQNGVLKGNITSKLCVVSGTIDGNIVSTDQMEIKSTAVIKGNIKSASINIEPGAVINGSVTVAEDTNAVIDLSDKIKEYLTDERLEAKLAAELADLNARTHTAAAGNEATPGNKMHWDFKSAAVVAPVNKEVVREAEPVKLNWDFNAANKVEEQVKPVIKTTQLKAAQDPIADAGNTQNNIGEHSKALAAKPKVPKAAVPEVPATDEGANSRWW